MNFGHLLTFLLRKGIIIEKDQPCWRKTRKHIQDHKGGDNLGKIDENKKMKKNALFQTAFELFTEKGFARTTIADIVDRAGLAKGTFYLYFKDKYDLRDKLIAFKSAKLFNDAHHELELAEIDTFQDEILFITDYIIHRFQNEPSLMQFVAKNLSWGVFNDTFSKTEFLVSQRFYDHYLSAMERYNIHCEVPELMLFTIIELIGSTSYNCILNNQPVSMDEYLPYLHKAVNQIIAAFTCP